MRKSARNVKVRKHIYDHMVEVSTKTTMFTLNVSSFSSPLKIENQTRDF